MKIELREITIADVFSGYQNNQEEGVTGYNGLLNIRPKYQREFVYDIKQQMSVIESVNKSFPLNVMYWIKRGDGSYEVLDGQQRTMSICEYMNNNFAIKYQYFHNLTDDEKRVICDYKLMVYFCEGTDKEALDWFKTINIAGSKLTDQELRNAIYTGTWLTDAKRYFSKTNCASYGIAKDYLKGSPIRQEYLETALRWISCESVESYMAIHQHDENANELWLYFQNVIAWVKILFQNYRKEMKGVDWGLLYNKHKSGKYDAKALERRVAELMMDEDVTRKSGIYSYLITGDECHLNIRAFSEQMKRESYERQKGVCPHCGKKFAFEEMEGDHIDPWHAGGKTNSANCQMLCVGCNRHKSGK